jgi:hypothetical protein
LQQLGAASQQLGSQQLTSQHDLRQQRFMLLHRSRKGWQRGLQQGAGSQHDGSLWQQVGAASQQVGSQQLGSQHDLRQQRNMSRRRQRGLQQGSGSQHDGSGWQQVGSQQLGAQQLGSQQLEPQPPCEFQPIMRSSISNALASGALEITNRAASTATGRTTRVLMGRVPFPGHAT